MTEVGPTDKPTTEYALQARNHPYDLWRVIGDAPCSLAAALLDLVARNRDLPGVETRIVQRTVSAWSEATL